MKRITALLLATFLTFSVTLPAHAFWARYSTSEAIVKYEKYIEGYQNDEVVKIKEYRNNYAFMKDSLADQLIERAIWYMEHGYMVYGRQFKGYKDYGIVDCSNFVSLVYSDFGFNITTTARNYNSVGKKVEGAYATKQGNHWAIQGTENLLPGDIFTYWQKDANGNKYISHVAIYMGMIDGKPAVIGTADAGNPTAIGIVNDVRYWWGSNFYTVRRVLPEGAWTAGKTLPGHEAKAPVIPKQYQLPPQKKVVMPGEANKDIKTTYTVKAGDSLWKIATTHGLTVQALIQVNHLTSTTIYIGQTLTIPTQNSYTVVAGDSMWKIAQQFGISLTSLIQANPTINPNYLYIGQILTLPA
ncbi:LysM peptidoglycan-binding domain-containing protein [Heliorestis convoluta]|uniref:LysM domain protein n=1 Tax=Heliorestis convoluta TaxID=356322 RepID=A0A5Q2N1Y2_9FIRM|nr:LysM peptidoglycan-binding domain-containing protein [Heliorestis convoluta]QGG48827.1 LysM domain protein [Heliorestis convoluta]